MSDMQQSNQDRYDRTAAELARLEAEGQAPKPVVKKKKKKVKEKTSTRNTSDDDINAGAERLMEPLRFELRDALLAGNKAKAADLRQRLLLLQASKL